MEKAKAKAEENRKILEELGIKADADGFRLTCSWKQACDVDLHLRLPSGTEIMHSHKQGDGWTLDVDDTGGGKLVENITYGGGSQIPDGKYEVKVKLYSAKGHSNVGYLLNFAFKGSLPKMVERTFESEKQEHTYPVEVVGGKASFAFASEYIATRAPSR